MMIKLESVGALKLVPTKSNETFPIESEDEVDSDYSSWDDDDSTFNGEEEYFLYLNDCRNYGDPTDGYFTTNNDSSTGTSVLIFLCY